MHLRRPQMRRLLRYGVRASRPENNFSTDLFNRRADSSEIGTECPMKDSSRCSDQARQAAFIRCSALSIALSSRFESSKRRWVRLISFAISRCLAARSPRSARDVAMICTVSCPRGDSFKAGIASSYARTQRDVCMTQINSPNHLSQPGRRVTGWRHSAFSSRPERLLKTLCR